MVKDILSVMRKTQTLKKRCIAIILSDVEKEFKWSNDIIRRSTKLKKDIRNNGRVNTEELVMYLSQVESQMPDYMTVRKIILDQINSFVRNVFQHLIGGEVEGYD